jgi:hypothetical protein
MLCCALCGGELSRGLPCVQTHPDHCHACWHDLLRGSMESHAVEPPPTLVLSPRDVQTLLAAQPRGLRRPAAAARSPE